jgi:hypothetical protein
MAPMKSGEHFSMNWLTCWHSFARDDEGFRPTAMPGAGPAAILESATKDVVIVCLSRLANALTVIFTVAQIAGVILAGLDESAARSPA